MLCVIVLPVLRASPAQCSSAVVLPEQAVLSALWVRTGGAEQGRTWLALLLPPTRCDGAAVPETSWEGGLSRSFRVWTNVFFFFLNTAFKNLTNQKKCFLFLFLSVFFISSVIGALLCVVGDRRRLSGEITLFPSLYRVTVE